MPRLAIALAVAAVTGLAAPALAQQSQVSTYDFSWQVQSELSTSAGAGPSTLTTYAFQGQGPLTLSAVPGATPQLTLTFADGTSSGRATFSLYPSLTPIATDNFGFTTGIPGPVPPAPFTGNLQGPIAIYTPTGDPLDPTRFTLTMTEAFDCGGLPTLARCGGVAGWSASLVGRAVLADDPPATAGEPWAVAPFAFGLLAALVARERRASAPTAR